MTTDVALDLPWAPLFTTERSGEPELTVSGILSIWDGRTQTEILAQGNTQATIWSRSLLKPWQLLVVYPTLKATYPGLQPRHYAMMMSSHQGEALHEETLRDLMMFQDISLREIKCPSIFPLSKAREVFLRAKQEKASPVYHPCCGKHLAYMLALHAQGKVQVDYLDPEGEPYSVLKSLLALLLDHNAETFPETIDGCGMPNYGLSATHMAQLFWHMANHDTQHPEDAKQGTMADLVELREVMMEEAHFMGGTGRLDTDLMSGKCWQDKPPIVIAKEGADGLLGVGIGPSERYPNGLGILIKLASGYDPQYLRKIVLTLLQQLQFKPAPTLVMGHPLVLHYHFNAATITP